MQFNKETPILYYEPRSSERWLKREYILFPAYSYRVLAPRVENKQLNILEKAILGIVQVGAFTAEAMGEILDIGTDLAALIISELQEQNLIDHRGLITNYGKKKLNNDIIETEELVAGYIFQEPWSGELFPRFIENLEYAETRFNENGYPELILGTTGKPFYQRIFMPLPVTNTLTVQPSPQDILRAVRSHNKTIQNRNFSQNEEAATDDERWSFDLKPKLKRISFIEEQPTPIWLATFIYTPAITFDEFDDNNNWKICDPFGLGDSPWLTRKINKLLKNKDSFQLAKPINDLIKQPSQVNKKQEEYQEWMMLLNDEAINIVEGKLSLEITKWKSLYNGLIAMERTNQEVKHSEGINYFLNDKIEDILVKCQKNLENLLLIIAEKYPTNQCWTMLDDQDKKYNQVILEKITEKIGFKLPLPKSLLSVDVSRIKSAADYQEGSLRGYIIAALLTAHSQEKHPFYFLAQNLPDLLFSLDKLASLRNKSSHYNYHKLDYSFVEQQINLVYQIINLFLQVSHQPVELEKEAIYV